MAPPSLSHAAAPAAKKSAAGVRSWGWTTGVVVAVSLGFVMAMLDVTVVNVALGEIRKNFDAPLSDLVWIVDAYTLTFAALLLLGGSLADRVGAKRAYMLGLIVFIVASGLCALAGSVRMLVGARLLQGCGAALFMPSSLSLLTQSFPERKQRARLVGIWGALVSVAAGSGPLIGGALVQHFGWRSIFYLNLPVGLAGALLTATLLRPSSRNKRHFDIVSHCFIVAALAGLSFTLIEGPALHWFAAPSVTAATALALAALALFILRERTAPHPVIPRALLQKGPFLALNGMGFLANFVIFGELFVVSLYLQQARGASALATGVAMLPMMVSLSIMNVCSGHLTAFCGGRRVLLVGNAVAAAGAGLAAWLGGGAPYWALASAIALCNAGFGLALPAMTTGVMVEGGTVHANVAAATLNANRQVGALAGVAAVGIVLHVVSDWNTSMTIVFAAFSVCLVGAFGLIWARVPEDA